MYIIDKRGDEFTNCCTTALKIAPQLARAFFSNYVKVNKMDYFEYHDNILCCDDVDVREIAQDVGTPFYLYSHRTLIRHCRNLDSAFGETPHLICYSVKSNFNLALLNILAQEGIGVDIVSGGELYRSLQAGFPPERIVYSGVGKTDEEIRYALKTGILAFNVESVPELLNLDEIAADMGMKARIAFRINPNVDPKTHPYIATGLRNSKFGIPHDQVMDTFRLAAGLNNVEVVGIDAHIGSQITGSEPFTESAERLADLANQLISEGFHLKHIDIGGGLGIRYEKEDPPDPSEWAGAVIPILRRTGLRVIIEPGRSLMGNAGILVTKVLYVKETPHKTFVIVDAAMTDMLRPSLYDAYHRIEPVVRSGGETVVADVVGPVCESSDFLARDRAIMRPERGDLLALMSAGAYGFVMASNYNSRPRAP